MRIEEREEMRSIGEGFNRRGMAAEGHIGIRQPEYARSPLRGGGGGGFIPPGGGGGGGYGPRIPPSPPLPPPRPVPGLRAAAVRCSRVCHFVELFEEQLGYESDDSTLYCYAGKEKKIDVTYDSDPLETDYA
ncbi:hypothetical protein AA313_de0200144 [Arthrobotrys entomopaga]|nr:hypothetical protein AA313_de0200144 [Arthrobotrys entomopaga]